MIATLVCTLEAANCLKPCVRHYCAQLQRVFSSSEREVLGLPHADGSVHATGLPLSLLKRIEGHTAFGMCMAMHAVSICSMALYSEVVLL